MKRLITKEEMKGLKPGDRFHLEPGQIMSPLARDYAADHGIVLGSESAFADRGDIAGVVTEEVLRVLGAETGSGAGPMTCLRCHDQQRRQLEERAVVSCTGVNQKGVVAKVSQVIAECGGDIRDISQTLVGGYFTMVIVLEISGLKDAGHTFKSFKERLGKVGQEMGVEMLTIHDDILSAMHRV